MNSFNIIGRLTKKPELRYTKENKAVGQINIAITNGKDDTTFLSITLFNKTAENVSKYCDKGSQMAITGIIKNHNWEDKEGNKHYDYNFIGQNVEFLSKIGNTTIRKEISENEPKNDPLSEDTFKEFGDKIEIDENLGF